MQKAWAAAAVLVLTLLPLVAQTWLLARSDILMADFRAFYCAARTASHGDDPYRTEPLRTCEIRNGQRLFYAKNRDVAVPAPLPGYTLAALMPLAALPFPIAAAVWATLLCAAFAACVALVVRCTGVAWQMALAAFSLSLGVTAISSGEIVALAVAAICAAAFFVMRGKYVAAALAAAAAMIEPHLGLPVCVALAVWVPATRLCLGAALTALGVVSVLAVGVSTNVEYFTRVLPAHALSEVARDTQYSLTSVLASAGVADGAAIQLGSAWYFAMVVAGVIIAGALARRTANAAYLAFVPPAFAVFGGAFVHITQIAAAIPAVLLLAGQTKPATRPAIAIALLLLAVPWAWAISPAVALAPAFPAAYLAWETSGRNLRAAMMAAVISGVALVGLNALYRSAAAQPVAQHAEAAIDQNLAQATWSIYTRRLSNDSLATWLARIPTWAGLVLVLGVAGRSVLATPLAGARLDSEPEPA